MIPGRRGRRTGMPVTTICVGVQPREQGVVVEHLLKVRDDPVGVGGVAVKASADLVVDSARGHAVQGQLDHLQGVRGAGAGVVSEQELQGRGLGELGL